MTPHFLLSVESNAELSNSASDIYPISYNNVTLCRVSRYCESRSDAGCSRAIDVEPQAHSTTHQGGANSPYCSLRRKSVSWACCVRSVRASSRSIGRVPPRNAFCDARALPSADFGPVDFCQGRHCRIRAACRLRREGVQPFAMLLLQ